VSDVPVLGLRGVTKSFASPGGPVEVLRGVDLDVAAGDFIAVTGPSGSGKSTFLNLAALLDHPTGGAVRFQGAAIGDLDERGLSELRKRRVGMVFQKYCLLPRRSVLDNVLFRFRYVDHDRSEARELALSALDGVGLASLAEREARLLSGGEMQRVALARATVLPPVLLAADEPTGNLDAAATETVMMALKRLNDQGLTVVLATHNETLLAYCSRHVICRDGRVHEAAA